MVVYNVMSIMFHGNFHSVSLLSQAPLACGFSAVLSPCSGKV